MSLILKLVAAAAVTGSAIAAGNWLAWPPEDPTDLVTLPASTFDYRQPGQFLRDATPVNPPLSPVTFDRPVAIMTHHVSRADYERCVEASACRPLAAPAGADAASVPAVGVSWHDASAYAAWLSRETGRRYRLPTDAEWAYAAAAEFRDNTVVEEGDAANPAKRWIATYESQAASEAPVDATPRPFGTFGVNANGLIDVAGNVWDWTATCFTRTTTSGAGTRTLESCGVRVVEGAHRTYVSDFVRDPKGGGCSVGAPPANLGIRLVQDGEATYMERVAALLGRLVPRPSHETRLSLL